ncbi:carboxylic ester hydrolase [Planotetraspora thailandica]|uniref:Carboxylic ester hydrolase n=1 Tax=Planotetraspora thailandica TaxID=487172 RepID=A0A8J3XZL7_9ACTN|nr:carboxylesterase family protein [Planotetraspora thailandica]GII58091.1 carboxylic ester hydrolase [Planotetraspora thailandica]
MIDRGVLVHTVSGTTRGDRKDDLAVFLGIPYAQPPVGALRFAAPRPPHTWDGVRDATDYGPPPPQSWPLPAAMPTGTEWLTLNVWSPDLGGARLPVLVWIHGGAYIAGASSDPMYDAAPIASHGLVVVTINYRVGVEGFAQIEGAPANRGLLDQIAALEWVKRNISAFGGDPERITVAGQSAGAGSIAALLTMPRAVGLFGRAITHSVPGACCTPALATDVTAALAARLGVSPTVAGLGSVDPQRIASAAGALMGDMPRYGKRWGRAAHWTMPFCPVLDGEVLPDTPWRALGNRGAVDIELLAGCNRDEFRLFMAMAGLLGKITEDHAEEALRNFAPSINGGRAYRAGYPDATAEGLFEIVHGDALFRMPTQRLAEAHSLTDGTAYLYELGWPSPAQGGILGACHSLDLPLLFGSFGSPAGRSVLGDQEPAAETLALAGQIRRAWTRFAVTGDPGWPAHRPDQRLTHTLHTTPATTPYPHEPSRRIWDGHDIEPFDLL